MSQQNNNSDVLPNDTPNETPNDTPNDTSDNIISEFFIEGENNINNFLRDVTNSIYNNTFFNLDESLNQNTILSPPPPPSTSPPPPPSTSPPPPPSTSPPPPPSTSPPPSPLPPESPLPPSPTPPPLPPRRTRILPQSLTINEHNTTQPSSVFLNHPNIHSSLSSRFILRPTQIRFQDINPDGSFANSQTYNISELQGNRDTLDSVIQRSFQDDSVAFKHIISDEGKKMLKSVKYSSLDTEEKKCGITQEEFDDDTMVIELPCKHVFCEEGIFHWLENESASCPNCRFKLPSNEVRINKSEERERERSVSAPAQTYSNYYQTIINNIVRIRERREEEDTQRAIWNSISQSSDQGGPAEQEYLSDQDDIIVD